MFPLPLHLMNAVGMQFLLPEVSAIKAVPQAQIHSVAAQGVFFKMEPGTCSVALVGPCFSIFQE